MPFHLLFPLAASLLFVVGMLFSKRAIVLGARPWTNTFFANLWLGLIWAVVGLAQGQNLPLVGWLQAALVGLAFVAGQLFTYLAFEHGDISLATPVFGVKVILVAILLALLADEMIAERIWIGAALATLGIVVLQSGARSAEAGQLTRRKMALTILLAVIAATCLSLFDVGLQTWGQRWGGGRFLPPMFVSAGVLSLLLAPRVDSPRRLLQLGALWPALVGTVLMAIQAMSMSYSLGHYGDATRINIVYALRGLWAVGLAWLLARAFGGDEARLPTRVMLLRLCGALLVTLSIIVALAE